MLLRKLKSRTLGASRHALAAAALAATVTLTGVTASQPASAAPVITDWFFNIDNGFFSEGPDAFAPQGAPPNGVVGSDPNAALSAATGQPIYTHLEWGDSVGSQRSSIDVGSSSGGNFTGMVSTNGGAVDTVMISHDNQVIPPHAVTLTTATLLDVLTLTPTANTDGPVVGAPITFPPLLFDIYFEETLNSDSPCNPPTVGPPGNCADIFAIDVTGAGFNEDLQIVQDISAAVGDGNTYFALITIEGLQLLDETTCLAAGFPMASLNDDDMCLGLITTEGMNNQFQVSLQITSPDLIPEPGSLAILAFGLVGLGIAGRRKRTA